MLVKVSILIDPKLVTRLAEAAEYLEVDFSDALARAVEEFVDGIGIVEVQDSD